jgi:hypothetical protein
LEHPSSHGNGDLGMARLGGLVKMSVVSSVRRSTRPRHRALGQAGLGRHRPGRQVRGVLRRRLQRLEHHRLDPLVGNRARRPGRGFVKKLIESISDEPCTPLTHRPAPDVQLVGDLGVRGTARAAQHNPRPQRQRLSGLRPTRPPLQRLDLRLAENTTCQLWGRTPPSRRCRRLLTQDTRRLEAPAAQDPRRRQSARRVVTMTAFVSAPNVCAASESAVALVEPVAAQSVTGPACCRWTSTNDGRGIRSSRRLPGTPTSLAWSTSPVRLYRRLSANPARVVERIT